MHRENSARTKRRLGGLGTATALLGILGLLLLPATTGSGLTASGAPRATAAEAPAGTAAGLATPDPTADLPGYAAATPAGSEPAPVEVKRSQRPGATPVKSTLNHPACGAGFTLVEAAGSEGFCIHSAPDPLPPVGPVAQAAAAAPVCMGNGVNGPRIQLIYMYVEGQPDRSAQVVPRIANEIVPRMEGVYRETSKLQGREIGMRLHMPDCKLAVDTVEIDEVNGEPDDTGAMLARITNHLMAAGYDSTDRKYVVWFDGGNRGACGVAPVLAPMLVPHATDNAVVGNGYNVGWQNRELRDATLGAMGRETAVIFRWGRPILGQASPGMPECWGQGGTGARTELHELTHLLGAVMLSAPNSNGLGHCVDDHDIMCYGEQGVLTVPRCATPVEQLDCGADDYFNARPPAGSYLSTHWNTANSRFLGEALIHDNVPAEIPRP